MLDDFLVSLNDLAAGRTRPQCVTIDEPAKAPTTTLPAPKINSLSYQPVFDPILGLDNLVSVWYLLYPDIELYPWQREELLRISGYPAGTTKSAEHPRRHHFHTDPYQAIYPCANGSGKDKVLIATAAIGLPLLYRNTSVVITSASYGQLKNQTQRYINDAIKRLNANTGVAVFESVEFYHRCEERGAHINLFVTDEAGRAEGWHPLTPDGLLVMILNEVKSINEDMLEAADRCHGWSHWLEVSSPGPRRGAFYRNWKNSVKYPNLPEPGRYFGRRVTADDCPHISEVEKSRIINKHTQLGFITQTSLYANFAEEETEVAVPLTFVENCESVKPTNDTDPVYGIGLDCAAGNDETALLVRKGNKVVDQLFFYDADTRRAVNRIHVHLLPYQTQDYIFNYDDGGLGRTFGDQLTNLGWTMRKRANQSAAFRTEEFLNLGAEMWYHVRELFERRQILVPPDMKLLHQLTTRPAKFSGNQGKKVMVSKTLLRGEGFESPDRADAFILAFFSYRPGRPAPAQQDPVVQPMTCADLMTTLRRDPSYLTRVLSGPSIVGTYTQQKNEY